jgi:hypothetical protein
LALRSDVAALSAVIVGSGRRTPARRYVSYLTPGRFAEKSRLTRESCRIHCPVAAGRRLTVLPPLMPRAWRHPDHAHCGDRGHVCAGRQPVHGRRGAVARFADAPVGRNVDLLRPYPKQCGSPICRRSLPRCGWRRQNLARNGVLVPGLLVPGLLGARPGGARRDDHDGAAWRYRGPVASGATCAAEPRKLLTIVDRAGSAARRARSQRNLERIESRATPVPPIRRQLRAP